MTDKHITFITGIVSLSLLGVIIAAVVGAKACNDRDDEYYEKVLTSCVQAGKDPLACKQMIHNR